MRDVTVKEFMDQHGLSQPEANSFLKVLAIWGFAKVSKVKKSSGRGKPTNVYQIPDTLNLDFEDLRCDTVVDDESDEVVDSGQTESDKPAEVPVEVVFSDVEETWNSSNEDYEEV